MTVTVKRAAGPAGVQPEKIAQPSPFDGRFGEWGTVETPHSEDNTADIFLDSGVYLNRVPVASREWVVSGEDAEKDYNSGERSLPPVHARVFVMMPSRVYSDCFIAPFSGFSTIDQTAPYMADDREKIRERIAPGGWHVTDDGTTGSRKAVSPDGKTSLEIDYGTEKEPKTDAPELHLSLFDEIKADVVADGGVTLSVFDEVQFEHVKGESCTVKVFDTEIEIKPGAVSLKPKETVIEVDGNLTVKTSGDAIVEAVGDATVKGKNINVEASASATVKAAQAKITGGQLTVTGAAAPGSGPLNCLAKCLFTGIDHGGNTVTGT
ncbi:MAG: hypothetical protein LBK61_02085 [Spirochaetaceae bacterium]|nr:hypothetical protein [Spirochaetaceae bacterium]